MSRSKPSDLQRPARPEQHTNDPDSFNAARIAEEIGMEALGMAKWARAAGLTTLGFLLESAALEAGAQVAAMQWPDDAPKR